MLQFGLCRRCQIEIPENRMHQNPVICPNCGYSQNTSEMLAEVRFERRFIKVAVTLALVMSVAFVQAATWDKYALEIIPLKIKQTLGMSSQGDLLRITQICRERLRHDCVETALAELSRQGHIEALAELGKFQFRRLKKDLAAQTFAQYFQRGGLDLEASYQYARVLGEIGQTDRSVSYFDHVLKSRPDTVQISVTQNYVRMLINNGRRDQAKRLIESMRKTSPSAALFMDEEFKRLAQVR